MLALRARMDELETLIRIMARQSPLPCFKATPAAKVVAGVRRMLMCGKDAGQVAAACARMAGKCLDHWGTQKYDYFQKVTNGILP